MLASMSFLHVWTLFGIVFVTTVSSVYVTNVRRSPRFLRILARNSFALTVLCFLYQMASTLFFVHPLPLAVSIVSPAPQPSVVSSAPRPLTVHVASGDSIVGGPSLSAAFVNRVLLRVGSPAAGTGQALYDLSAQYHVDDAYALSTFQHESTYGRYGAGAVNRSLGNIVCAGYPTCNGRFRSYLTWQEGYADFYRLIAREYIAHGCSTLSCIIPVYAPPSENNTVEYVQTIRSQIAAFRLGRIV